MLYQVNRQFSIEWIGNVTKQNYAKDFDYIGECHDFTEIVFVAKGVAEKAEDGNIYVMQSGDIIFHAPMEFHTVKALENTPLTLCFVSCVITGRVPENLYDGFFNLSPEDQTYFMGFVDKAEKTLKKGIASSFEVQFLADELSAFILKLCMNNDTKKNFSVSNSAKLFKNIVNEMNENIYTNISLTEISKKFNISTSYVKSIFYKYSGISPKKYYSQLRIVESIRLIEKGLSTSEIAEKMNFSSASHFSVFFKENMGISPSKYGKSSHKKERTV